MSDYDELRDPERARRFVQQGLWWQRVTPPTASGVREMLEWARTLISSGQPLPPLGFVADVGHAALGHDFAERGPRDALLPPGLDINLVRTYEDHVLGKLYADWTFTRAGEALRQPIYQSERNRARGLAFLLTKMREHAGYGGVEISPGVLQSAADAPPEELLRQGWESLRQDGPMLDLVSLYQSLIDAARRTAEVLGQEDLFELEHGTALDEEGPRVARKHVLRAAALFEAALPRHRLRPRVRRMEVPTRILDEDTYPVGGFTSLSNRGSVESLLHSQLAYMENDERPDLFDVKFLRDELLYYARDENQFLRRRRSFVLALAPGLTSARFMDFPPYQRVVLLQALLLAAVRKLTDWLSADALLFEVLFLQEGGDEPLTDERKLMETLLSDQIQNGTVRVGLLPAGELAAHCTRLARRSLCCCLLAAPDPPPLLAADVTATRLAVDGPRPALGDDYTEPQTPEADEHFEAWGKALEEILQRWM
jgi:hypothetical protein